MSWSHIQRAKRKLHRKKILKGMFYNFNGSTLWKYHAYQGNRNSRSIMLMYDETGNECYFNNWKDAKKYIRTMKKRPPLWETCEKCGEPIFVKENDYCDECLNYFKEQYKREPELNPER